METIIRFNLNGKKAEITVDPTLTLLWILRDQFGLTGTKYGCGEGICGSCTVLIDNVAYRSCMIQVGDIANQQITTIEGLSQNGLLHPLQTAFIKNFHSRVIIISI